MLTTIKIIMLDDEGNENLMIPPSKGYADLVFRSEDLAWYWSYPKEGIIEMSVRGYSFAVDCNKQNLMLLKEAMQ
jgi:hypothetical protein